MRRFFLRRMKRAYLGRFVIEVSLTPHDVRCSETPGPWQSNVRQRRPRTHDVTTSLARPRVETRSIEAASSGTA